MANSTKGGPHYSIISSWESEEGGEISDLIAHGPRRGQKKKGVIIPVPPSSPNWIVGGLINPPIISHCLGSRVRPRGLIRRPKQLTSFFFLSLPIFFFFLISVLFTRPGGWLFFLLPRPKKKDITLLHISRTRGKNDGPCQLKYIDHIFSFFF